MNNMNAVKNKSKNIGETLCTFCKTFISLSDDKKISNSWKEFRNTEEYIMAKLSCITAGQSNEINNQEIDENNWGNLGTFINYGVKLDLTVGNSVYINSVVKKMIKDLTDKNVVYYRGASGIGKSIGMILTSQFVRKMKTFQIFIEQPGAALGRCDNVDAEYKEILAAMLESNEQEVLIDYLETDLESQLREAIKYDKLPKDLQSAREPHRLFFNKIAAKLDQNQSSNPTKKVYVFVDNVHDLIKKINQLQSNKDNHPLLHLSASHTALFRYDLRVAASQHFGYNHLQHQSRSRITNLSIPSEPMDIYGLKTCMRLAENTKYVLGTKNESRWPDRCIIHSGGIARVALVAFNNLDNKNLSSKTSNVEEDIRNEAISAFSKKIQSHIEIRLQLDDLEVTKYKQFLEKMAILLEQNVPETALHVNGVKPDEAVYMGNKFVSGAAQTAYRLAISRAIPDYMFIIDCRNPDIFENTLIAKINAMGIDFEFAEHGEKEKGIGLSRMYPAEYIYNLRYRVTDKKPSFDSTDKKAKEAFSDFCESRQFCGHTARFHVEGVGDKLQLPGFDVFYVQKLTPNKNRFLMVQISTESNFSGRIEKMKVGGLQLLNALLKLWNSDLYATMENDESHGITIKNVHNGQESEEADAKAIYMNHRHLKDIATKESFQDLIVIDGDNLRECYNFRMSSDYGN